MTLWRFLPCEPIWPEISLVTSCLPASKEADEISRPTIRAEIIASVEKRVTEFFHNRSLCQTFYAGAQYCAAQTGVPIAIFGQVDSRQIRCECQSMTPRSGLANSRARVPWGRLKARHPAILPQRRGVVKSPSNDEEKRTDSRHIHGSAVTL